MRKSSAVVIGTILFGVLLGFLALGNGTPKPAAAPPSGATALHGSRDAFGPDGSLQPRLSRKALEEATRADQEAERSRPAGRLAEGPSAAPASPLPAHRFSRDSSLHAPAAPHQGTAAAPDWQITLKNTFIEKYKNRALISTPFQVLFFKPHDVVEDGDEHVAGLADEVGLACVAEIMNIADRGDAKALVQQLKGSGAVTPLTGVWRLWCEHPDQHPETAGPQIQDDVIPPYPDSNPNHVFEIHPISQLGQLNLLNTFHPIPEPYKVKDAKKAFQYYDSLTCKIVPDPANQTTTLFTPKAGYNYTRFRLRVEDDEQFITLDGRLVRCAVLDLNGNEVVNGIRRMVFVKGTPPEAAVQSKKKGDSMDVLGIPRIDLALVSYRCRVADSHPEVLTWNLPYEMIVVGVYGQ